MRKITVGTFKATEQGIDQIEACLRSGRISQGKHVAEFEEAFAQYHGIEECVAVSTGTGANTVALAWLQDWDRMLRKEVILPALTFVSCANSVLHAGFWPKFVDVSRETYLMDIQKVEDADNDNIKAVMIVHLFGRPVNMDEVNHLRYHYYSGMPIIEDCAEAHGAMWKGRKVGTFGDVGTFSFYVAHIITSGEGGAIITPHPGVAEKLRSTRAHGRACCCKKCVLNIDSEYCPLRLKSSEDKRFDFQRVGYSEKMNELQGILGLTQVHQLDAIVSRRKQNMNGLLDLLSIYEDDLQLPREGPHESISPLCFPMLIKEKAKFTRSQIVRHLESRGIETRPMFNSIPTQQPAYAFMGHKKGEFPNAEYIGEHGFYIGCHQNLTDDDIGYIGGAFKAFFDKEGAV